MVDGFRDQITAGVRKQLSSWMKAVAPRGEPSPADLEKPFHSKPDKKLTRQVQQLLSSAYVLGMDHAGSNITTADLFVTVNLIQRWDALPFKDAISAIKSRVSLTKAEWKALEPKLRFRAFTVANLSAEDAIERVRQSAVSALEQGKPFSEFWSEAMAADSAGISASSPWYWETVYRTNVQTAYNTGRAAEFARTKPEYLEFVGIEDDRQTTICEQRSGIVRPADDPWWQANWPPLHFRCRSTPRGVWKEEAELLHIQSSSEERLKKLPAPAGEFGANPLSTESFWKITPSMLDRAEKYGVADELRAFAKDLGLPDPVMGSRLASKVSASAQPGAAAEYVRELTDPSGGYVDVSTYHGATERSSNVEAARILAGRGQKVLLLPVDNISKSADALVDGVPTEFKRPRAGSLGAIDRALREGRRQAGQVLIRVIDSVKRGDLKNVISNRLARAPELERLIVVIGDKTFSLTRDEILKGNFGGL